MRTWKGEKTDVAARPRHRYCSGAWRMWAVITRCLQRFLAAACFFSRKAFM